jgi:hypothetical protein
MYELSKRRPLLNRRSQRPARSRFGVVEPMTTSPEPRGGAAVRFLTPEPGRVVEVNGVDAVHADPALVDLVRTEPVA